MAKGGTGASTSSRSPTHCPAAGCHPGPWQGRGPRDRRESKMVEATETSKLTMGEEEAMSTARRLCGGYLEHRGMEVVDDGSAGGTIVARDCDEVVLVRVTASVGGDERALPALDVSEVDAADMRTECLRYLLGHRRVDAVRHDVVAVAITGDRQANLRHLVGVCRWSEDWSGSANRSRRERDRWERTPAVPISHRHGRSRTLPRPPSPPSGTPSDGGEGKQLVNRGNLVLTNEH